MNGPVYRDAYSVPQPVLRLAGSRGQGILKSFYMILLLTKKQMMLIRLFKDMGMKTLNLAYGKKDI